MARLLDQGLDTLVRSGRGFEVRQIRRYRDGMEETDEIIVHERQEQAVMLPQFTQYQLQWYRATKNSIANGGGMPYTEAERELFYRMEEAERGGGAPCMPARALRYGSW